MKKIIMASILALSLTFSASGGAAEEGRTHAAQGAEGAVPPEMAVKHEMRLLDAAFKNLLDAILLDAPETIEAPFHKVHKAKMNTEKALKAGKVKLPKNSDKLEEFVQMDEAFHGKLVKLLGAARKKDREGIKASAHEILDSCVQCHNRFRN